jgi:hypothetical protein
VSHASGLATTRYGLQSHPPSCDTHISRELRVTDNPSTWRNYTTADSRELIVHHDLLMEDVRS